MTHIRLNAQIIDDVSQFFFQISRPVHVILKTDKWDYLRCPKTKLFFESFFAIKQGSSSTGKWNWNLLGFSSFTSILGQCAMSKEVLTRLEFFTYGKRFRTYFLLKVLDSRSSEYLLTSIIYRGSCSIQRCGDWDIGHLIFFLQPGPTP